MAPNFWASALLAAMASQPAFAHVSLTNPYPFVNGNNYELDDFNLRSPMKEATYPCNVQSFKGADVTRAKNQLAVGDSHNLTFYHDAAVHRGGTCQLSITYDLIPTRKSIFKTFYTIEGGCPGNGDGNAVAPQPYQLPSFLREGSATFAWSWFPAASGANEMYMNCAPITITGGSGDDAQFNQLPDMLVANIEPDGAPANPPAPGSSQSEWLQAGYIPPCDTALDAIAEIPNPGELFVNSAALSVSLSPIQTAMAGCPSKGVKAAALSGTPPTAAASAATGSAQTSAPTPPYATAGIIMGEGASSPAATPVVSSEASAAAPAMTTFQTAAAPAIPAADPTQADDPPSTVVASLAQVATPSAPSNSTGPCSTENDGQVVCNERSQFGLCSRGSVVWQDVAAGMVCENGKVIGKEEARLRRSSHLHAHGRLSRRRQGHGGGNWE